MSTVGIILEAMKTGMQSGLPNRIVTRSMRDFSERETEDDKSLIKGIFTIVGSGITRKDKFRSWVDLLLVGQIKIDEQLGGDQIEDAELSLVDDIYLMQAAISIQYNLQFDRIIQSRQLENPYGWVNCPCRLGPFNLTPNLANASAIDDFLLFHSESAFGGNAPDPVLISEENLPPP